MRERVFASLYHSLGQAYLCAGVAKWQSVGFKSERPRFDACLEQISFCLVFHRHSFAGADFLVHDQALF